MDKSIIFVAGYYFVFVLTIGVVAIYFMTLVVNMIARVPFVPTSQRIVDYIISVSKLKPGEKVYDLGCGDGRFLLSAQKKTGTLAVGYENAMLPFLLAQFRKLISGGKIRVNMSNFFKADLSDANVIYCYLGPEVMTKLSEKFKKECKKGTRIYSNAFSIKTMKPEKVWPRDPEKKLPTVYLYKI